MPDGHCADPSLPLHLDQGRGSSKKESFSLRVRPAVHPPERPSPRRADMAGHGHGSGDAGTEILTIQSFSTRWAFLFLFFSFLVRKIPFAGIELTSQRVRGLRGTSELPGLQIQNRFMAFKQVPRCR